MDLQTTLKIGCFVFVDHVALGKLIQHGGNHRQQAGSFLRGVGTPQFAHRVAGGLVVILVAGVFSLCGPDALDG